MICPVCAAALEPSARSCPACGAELIEYLKTYYQADVLFNDALTRMRRGRYPQAAELLCRAAGLRPADAGILTLWAEAALLAGDPAGAARILEGALELDDSERVREQHRRALETLEAAGTPADALVRKALSAESARLEQAALRLEAALQRLEGGGEGEKRP
jgi:thioredoxin-like negative regulator of GroEL